MGCHKRRKWPSQVLCLYLLSGAGLWVLREFRELRELFPLYIILLVKISLYLCCCCFGAIVAVAVAVVAAVVAAAAFELCHTNFHIWGVDAEKIF